MRFIIRIATLIICLQAISSTATISETKLDSPESNSMYGAAVTVDGSNVVVGAYRGGFQIPGLSYVYNLTSGIWTQQAIIGGDVDNNGMGSSVMLAGDDLVLGSYTAHGGHGADGETVVFKKNGNNWDFIKNLPKSPLYGLRAEFGWSVSISGDYIIVGANKDDSVAVNSGSAFIYYRNAGLWSWQAQLLPSNPQSNALFGVSVSISGDYAIIGASGVTNNQGAAYIFNRNGTNWVQQASLTVPNLKSNDYFGGSVSISGTNAVVGAKGHDTDGKHSGCAYLFSRVGTNWSFQTQLTGSTISSNADFGCSVFMKSSQLIVGANTDNQQGSAFVYNMSTGVWSQVYKLSASNGVLNGTFGDAVSITPNYAVVGSIGANAAYVYDLNSIDSDADGIPDWWMLQQFGHATGMSGDKSMATDDYDGDRYTTMDEYLNGTAPKVFTYGRALPFNADRYVSKTGIHQYPYTNWFTAASNIQASVTAAGGGDTVWVTNGIYMLTNPISITTDTITVSSINGPLVTTIDGGYPSTRIRCVNLNNQSTISGFTIQNGCVTNTSDFGGNGGGIQLQANGIVQNCIIRNNYAANGGGGVNSGYGSLIQNSILYSNTTATSGGGINCGYVGSVRNCLIYGNTATNAGGGINCDHLGYDGGNVENCTIVSNTAVFGGGVFEYQQGFYQQGYLRNLIVYYNTATTSGDNYYNLGGDPSNRYSYCCTTPLIGIGGISNAPLFASGYRLTSSSPCLDKGTNLSWMVGATDLDGNTRIGNGTVDMGAYELGFYIGIRYSAIDVTWNSASGVTYQVQSCTNLVNASWTNVSSSVTATGTSSYVPDWIRDNNCKFYRVTIP